MRIFRLLALLLVGGLFGACSSSDATQKCDTPLDCDQANTCIEGKCAQVVCEAYEDCPGEDETCLLGADPDQVELKFCTPVECKTNRPCEPGFTCNEYYQCVASGDVVEADVIESDLSTSEVVEDVGENPGTVGRCKACSSDGDCDGLKCTPLGGGAYCFGECATNDDCESGWYCEELTNESSQCIPMAYNCDADCHISGCPDDQVCNQETGGCQAANAECGTCQQDWDCAAGLRCYNEGNYCAPACGEGCPANSSCKDVNSISVKLCISVDQANCCFGDDCVNPCQAPTPFMGENGLCVECLSDGDCGEAKYCEADSQSCMDAACQAPTPFQLEDGTCVECKTTGHCAAKGADYQCENNVCVNKGDLPEECSLCVSPYPACAEINGIWACVQCAADADCSNGTCDLSLYACSGGGIGPGCGSCTNDGDCVSAMGDKVLACDAASGCCYDTSGFCDNVESMCDSSAGSECLGLMDLLMGGMGGFPGMPEGSVGGICTCETPVPMMELLMCAFTGSCPSNGCLGDAVCIDPAGIPIFGDIMGALGGAAGICINPASLMDILP